MIPKQSRDVSARLRTPSRDVSGRVGMVCPRHPADLLKRQIRGGQDQGLAACRLSLALQAPLQHRASRWSMFRPRWLRLVLMTHLLAASAKIPGYPMVAGWPCSFPGTISEKAPRSTPFKSPNCWPQLSDADPGFFAAGS